MAGIEPCWGRRQRSGLWTTGLQVQAWLLRTLSLSKDNEPQTASDELVGALHGNVHHQCEWMNVRHDAKLCGGLKGYNKVLYKCSPFTMHWFSLRHLILIWLYSQKVQSIGSIIKYLRGLCFFAWTVSLLTDIMLSCSQLGSCHVCISCVPSYSARCDISALPLQAVRLCCVVVL